MAGPAERDESISELLIDLENGQSRVFSRAAREGVLTSNTGAKIPAKQRGTQISNVVERLCSKAYEDGLSNSHLSKLIDIIALPNELDQASLRNLIKSLYPNSKVPDTIVLNVVGSLGHGRSKPSYTVQAALLKWLVMIYDTLENQKVLSQLYGVLFNLLDTIATRYSNFPSKVLDHC